MRRCIHSIDREGSIIVIATTLGGMKNTLIAEVRPDKDGKLVTRHVRADKGAAGAGKALPSPSLTGSPQPKKRRVFKPNEQQLRNINYGIAINTPDPENWGPHVIGEPHRELKAIRFTEIEKRKAEGNWYRFQCNELEYYSVLSVVRPFDAMNLLHRGIRSADEAIEFLHKHGIEHLSADYSEYTEELLRQRVGPNMAAVYLDSIIDSDADPQLAADWVKMCSQKSIIDKAIVIKDEMLSGDVTIANLKAVGVKNIAPDIKTVARYIIHSKHDGNPDFTLDDIAEVMSGEVDSIAYEKSMGRTNAFGREPDYNRNIEPRLSVARFHGAKAGSSYSIATSMYEYQLRRMNEAGAVDEKRLADLTLYATRVNAYLHSREDFDAMVELHDSGASYTEVNDFLSKAAKGMKTSVLLNAAKERIHSVVSEGWL